MRKLLLTTLAFAVLVFPVLSIADDLADDDDLARNPDAVDLESDSTFNDAFFYSPHYNELSEEWDHSFSPSVGFSQDSGNFSEIDLDIEIGLVSTLNKFRNNIDGLYSYSESRDDSGSDAVTSRKYRIKDIVEWHFHEKYYAFIGGKLKQNKPAGLESRRALRAGAGVFPCRTIRSCSGSKGGMTPPARRH